MESVEELIKVMKTNVAWKRTFPASSQNSKLRRKHKGNSNNIVSEVIIASYAAEDERLKLKVFQRTKFGRVHVQTRRKCNEIFQLSAYDLT